MLPIPVDWTERVANLFLKTLQKILKTVFVKYISYLIYNFSLTFTTTALKKVNKFSPLVYVFTGTGRRINVAVSSEVLIS